MMVLFILWWNWNITNIVRDVRCWLIKLQKRIQKINRPCKKKSEISRFCYQFLKIFPDFGRYLKFLPCKFTIFTWLKSAPAVAYLEVGRTTFEKSKAIIKVVKKWFFFTFSSLKNNFNDFSSLLHPCTTYLRYTTACGVRSNIHLINE